MGFNHALSGLNAASKSLDVIGHNIANSGTTGFKSSRAEFSEAVASALGASSGQSYGIGVTTAAVSQQFKQGNITNTGNNLDVAINGNGFFVVQPKDSKEFYYTRSGNFKLDNEGYLRTVNGDSVQGYEVDPLTGNVNLTSSVSLQFPTGKPIPALQTSNAVVELNLDSRVGNAAGDPTSNPPVAATPRSTYGTSISVFDQQGTAIPVSVYFEKSGPNQWNIFNKLDDMSAVPPVINPSTGYLQMDNVGRPMGIAKATAFDTDGYPTKLDYQFIDSTETDPNLKVKTAEITRNWTFTRDPVTNNILSASYTDTVGTATPLGVTVLEFKMPVTVDSSGTNPNNLPTFNVDLDLGGITQFGTNFSVSKLSQDGYAAGYMTGINISEEGFVVANYSNGIKRKEGQLIISEFRNSQGLASVGGDKWAATTESGNPNWGVAKSGTRGSLNAGALEESNVDLTAELVNMMTAQRAYQASAQAIKTQDQVFSTLVNLR